MRIMQILCVIFGEKGVEILMCRLIEGYMYLNWIVEKSDEEFVIN